MLTVNPSLSITLKSESEPGVMEGARPSPEERDRTNLTRYPCISNTIRTIMIREVINNATENGFAPFSTKEYTANAITPNIGININKMSKEKNSTILRLFVTYFIDSISMNGIYNVK